MQRFSAEVKLFALDERRLGKRWKEVRQGIEEKFRIPPPSLRALEKWQKTLDREKLSQLIVEESRKALPIIETTVLQQMATGLIPILWQARAAGGDMELEGWLWFFSVIERQLGEAKLEEFLGEYNRRKCTVGKEPSSTLEEKQEKD